MSDVILVRGGAPLNGAVEVLGAKNAVLKLMVATLLAPGRHVIENAPNILDVEIMGRVLDHVGATCVRSGTTLTIAVPEDPNPEAPLDLVRQMREACAKESGCVTRCAERAARVRWTLHVTAAQFDGGFQAGDLGGPEAVGPTQLTGARRKHTREPAPAVQ